MPEVEVVRMGVGRSVVISDMKRKCALYIIYHHHGIGESQALMLKTDVLICSASAAAMDYVSLDSQAAVNSDTSLNGGCSADLRGMSLHVREPRSGPAMIDHLLIQPAGSTANIANPHWRETCVLIVQFFFRFPQPAGIVGAIIVSAVSGVLSELSETYQRSAAGSHQTVTPVPSTVLGVHEQPYGIS